MSKSKIVQIASVPLVYIRGNRSVAELIGLPNIDMVTELVNSKDLPRYPRGKGYVFKVSDCLRVAELMDRNIIVPKTK